MRWNSIKILPLLSVLFLLVTGCSSDINEEKSNVVEAAKKAFEGAPEETNTKSGEIEFYLPSGYQIEEEDEYNITLKNKGDIILLFINPNEEATSTLLLDLIEQDKGEYLEYVKFEEKDKIGFVALKEIDEKTYELTVGVGGVKITTQTEAKRLESYAEQLMKMANSIEQYNH